MSGNIHTETRAVAFARESDGVADHEVPIAYESTIRLVTQRTAIGTPTTSLSDLDWLVTIARAVGFGDDAVVEVRDRSLTMKRRHA